MHAPPLLSMNNDVNSSNNEAWFMNKISEAGVTKIPTSILLGSKQRSLDDILGFSLVDCKSQKQACQYEDRKNGSYRLGCISSARHETGISTRSWAQLFADDDNKEMEKMTLQDIQRMLTKASKRSSSKLDSAERAGDNHSYSTSDSETFPSVDSEAPSVGLQLLLEDSTSNSSDSMSLKRDIAGISSSSGTSRGFLQGSSADLCGHKRSSTGSESRVETDAAEDDDWTLYKWQKLHQKQHAGGKRLSKPCKVQQEIAESVGEVCSNSPFLALLDSCVSISEVESSQGATFLLECKVIKDTCETDTRNCEPCEMLAAVKHPLPILAHEDSSQMSASFCSSSKMRPELEDGLEIATSKASMPGRLQNTSNCEPHEILAAVKHPLPILDISAQEDSSQMSASFCSSSTVRPELEDELEIAVTKASMPGRLQNTSRNGWVLKACDRIETTLPKLASQQAMPACNTNFGTSFRKAGELWSFNPDRASVKVSGWKKQCENITSSLSLGDTSRSKQLRTATPMHHTDGMCMPKAVLSEELRHLNVNQGFAFSNKESSNPATEQFEGTLPLGHCEGTDSLEQSDSIVSQLNSKGLPVFQASLNCRETLEIEEEQEPHQKPAKLPCKRKAISPMSQEFLLKASKLGEFGVDAEKRGWVDEPKWTFRANERHGQKQEALGGISCHKNEQVRGLEVLQSNTLSIASSANCVVGPTTTSQHTPVHVKNVSLISPAKPQNINKITTTISPSALSPSMPAKGILRSSCQGPCSCEECASVRSRAERASEFSQRQMQDIEGLAVKLMKDLSILRNIVEDRLIQSSAKHESPRPVLSIDQLKKATTNASETEETAKKWLIRMARDCNRYCKIMRMQGRKLTFADESGGKLCHVKVFHSEPCSDSTTGLHRRPLETNCSTSSTANEPAVEVGGLVEGTI